MFMDELYLGNDFRTLFLSFGSFCCYCCCFVGAVVVVPGFVILSLLSLYFVHYICSYSLWLC